MPTKLTPEIINAAVLGFEEQKRHIDSQIGELRAMLPSRGTEAASPPQAAKRQRRKMSAAGRKAIAEAQRKSDVAAAKKPAKKTAKKKTAPAPEPAVAQTAAQ